MLLASWLETAKLDEISYDFTEFFAGQAAVTTCFRHARKAAVAIDLDYDQGATRPGGMDLTTPAGFLCLACRIWSSSLLS